MASKEFRAFKSQSAWMPEHDVTTEEGLNILRAAMRINTLPGGVLPDGVSSQRIECGGVPCEWVRIKDSVEGKVILHIHGGSFISGEPCSKLFAMIRIAQQAGIDILSVDYRLAPEYPYPAALEDCAAVYQALLDGGYKPENVIIFGESAGATLTLCTALLLKSRGVPQPKALIALSPVADLSQPMEARREYAPDDPLLEEGTAFRLYYQQNDTTDPLISPAMGDLTGLPPILLHAGTHEILAYDAQRLIAKAVACDVDIQAHFWSEMEHGLFLFAGVFPEATAAGDEIISFIKKQFSIPT